MKSALYAGFVAHQRFIPRPHRFSYPFFMWFLDLDNIDTLPDIGRWFSTRRLALSRFCRPDYLGNPCQPLHDSVKKRMQELTGKEVTGKVFGLLTLRTCGLYFSPVNFYFGYDQEAHCTHMLAEVSNIPWNERHHYAHYIGGNQLHPVEAKEFKVSPFNPVDQQYTWTIKPPGKKIVIGITVHDQRGHIFDANLNLQHHSLDIKSVRGQLLRKPIMTTFIVAAIYWQALRLYLKGVPYVPYLPEKKEIT